MKDNKNGTSPQLATTAVTAGDPFGDLPDHGLLLSRYRGEQVVLSQGGRVIAVVEIDDIDRQRVRLRVISPPDVGVDRLEVFESKTRERRGGWK